ncbi:MAG: RNA ligase [Halodesulfurarchaeum sp.]
MDLPETLGVEEAEAEEVLEHFTEATYRGRTYRYLSNARRGIERGTAIVDDAVVRGYPSIPRVLVLETGIPAYFDGPLAVTEKLNGFNVRIVNLEEPLAFTRGGYICPYTTDIARDLLGLESFFDDFPEQMLCTEFIGPENPYTAHEYPDVDSVAARVFDVRDRESGASMDVENRRELLTDYDLPQPELFGTYDPDDAVSAVRDVIEDLDERGREGVVMQSVDGRDLLKYTTGHQHRSDLAFAFSLPFDYGRDFLFSRLIREGFQAVEFDEDGEELRERAHGLGEALLEPMVETIRQAETDATIGERHTVRAPPGTVDALLSHLERQNVTVEIESDRRDDGLRVVEFVKVSSTTRDKIDHFLAGGTIDE